MPQVARITPIFARKKYIFSGHKHNFLNPENFSFSNAWTEHFTFEFWAKMQFVKIGKKKKVELMKVYTGL